MGSGPARLDEVAHLVLAFGRTLLQNNADAGMVQDAIGRVAAAFGCTAHAVVTYETLLVTISRAGEFRTKTGNHVPAINVNMAAVTDVEGLLRELEATAISLEIVQARIDAIDRARPMYSRWIVVAGLGITAASLSRLFGGDWPTFFVTSFAGVVGTWLRQEIALRGGNVFFGAFAGALISGVVGGAAVLLGWSALPALCFLAPGMIIVPGVPLVNGVQDVINNHMTLGIARLGFSGFLVLAIAMGLAAATVVTGVSLPVAEASHLPSLASDALFSGMAALGYLFLFQVPARLAWVGILCGIASHTTRTFFLIQGMDIVAGSLIGALAAGVLAHGFARAFDAPVSAFAFPGVVAMIPGSFAFRAVVGYLEIVKAGGAASPGLVTETLSLSVTSLLMVLAITVGVVAPLACFPRRRSAAG